MAKLNVGERRRLEKLFDMGGGYVLDFSNRTLEEFVYDSVEVEIYHDRYHHGSGSKANRIRGFWKVEPEARVGKLIHDLVDHAEEMYGDDKADEIAECRTVVRRLLGSPINKVLSAPHSLSAANSASVHLQDPASQNVQQTLGQPVRVFISYSWESDTHKDWVRELADCLATNGIDITLDQYDLQIGQDRFHFMESSVRDADVVLCVCTPSYVSKANNRDSGAGVETSLMTPQFFNRVQTSKQFIPLIRRSDSGPVTPDYLSSLIFVDFRDNLTFDDSMESLLRHLHREPRHPKPQVRSKPNFGE
jgi:hypothetical protein